jgi:hypothetical protein
MNVERGVGGTTPRRDASPADTRESHDDLRALVIRLGERIDLLTAQIEKGEDMRRL